jgi:predicted ATPase
LINLRSTKVPPTFRIDMRFSADPSDGARQLRYEVEVSDLGDGTPVVMSELLTGGSASDPLISTFQGKYRVLNELNARMFQGDRLALSNAAGLDISDPLSAGGLLDFWTRAVFLRLSPNRLSQGSLSTRRSSDPILDEEGQTLPALLFELDRDQRSELIDRVHGVLDNFEGLEVREANIGRETQVNYALRERMPYRGRAGSYTLPVPSWMLSEGTRRITALMALLVREPSPSLICVEEIENGLDPWVVLRLIDALREASDFDTQVVLTTHSPWLLDHCAVDEIISVRRTAGDTKYERFTDREDIRRFDSRIPPGTRYVNADFSASE